MRSGIHGILLAKGYDGGVTGGIIEMGPFAREFFPDTVGVPDTEFYCKFNNKVLQTFASIMHFTGAVAALPAGYYTAKYGRTRYGKLRQSWVFCTCTPSLDGSQHQISIPHFECVLCMAAKAE